MRLLYLCLGWLMVATGIVGAFLPVLPTTPFLLLALWCFSRSSPKLEAWLLAHPRFGPSLQRWRERGAIARNAKIAALSAMSVSYAAFWFLSEPPPLRAAIVAAVMLGSALFIATRPES
ncbi:MULTISPECIES: YbaN family protein [Agrobacterium]|jgi:uncharacterized membrane protein YbaN (DUF454 family)|uniref:DUF454 domain-containing protein n=5 Tax=Agrobacterium TaxID=357 RepID=A0AAP4YQ71_AGRTU|nr:MULTISPECIES: YbaN family protein [Agrobacterium]MCP2133831.1 uncharacterized membrane protein YbaN (DUF454 family) [Rhizobium sp. SLBN-94]TGE80811.1 DUF454 domain-containing protein [Rhizobium sp. SEMIA 439]AYM06338.1 membrane protein [Agrobacterium tumefaciens]AYM81967.1 membrane protein [Agrobacterium tumefaciens]EPR22067.1 membrane protein [Agrobacterium radiobacter DSM 30147]